MGLNRYAKRRDITEPEIRAELHRNGCWTFALDKPLDLLCCDRGRLFLVECKTEGGRLTLAQRDFFENEQLQHSIPAFVADHIDDVPVILERVRLHYVKTRA